MDKKRNRLRRARRARGHINKLGVHRLCIHRTLRHIYAQVISPGGATVLVSASTVEADVRKDTPYGGNANAAQTVGRMIAERSLKVGIEKVAFDRAGFKYHGRIKALADAARENGLQF